MEPKADRTNPEPKNMTVPDFLLENITFGATENLERVLFDPKFEETRKCHDWRNYIPDFVCDVWEHLPPEAKLVAYDMALVQANREEWE
jgi:hypothetical protein